MARSGGVLIACETLWMCLEELMDRRWWGRLWIVQEVIVLKLPLIICWKSFWKFTNFTKIIGFALAHKLDIFSPVIRDSPFTKAEVLLELFRTRSAENPGFHLEYYTLVFGPKYNCLKLSDKARALLGLANRIDGRGVTHAGYHPDDPPSVMYRKIAAYIVTYRYHNSELDFLCPGHGPRWGMSFLEGTPPLPTWVPDLSIPPWESFATPARNA
ncbi:hypothetical protein B0O99DRAFT_590482 [Bisporella sp. PMI_857]|nr:hypothetical protein B0O99DRAFT_590482 [Bisporella sp. PMI_857]